MSMTDAAMAPPAAGGGPVAGAADGGDKQAAFERYASQLLEYLYSDGGMADTKAVLQNAGDDVPGAIGSVVAKSMAGLVMQTRELGKPVDPQVVYAIAVQLCNAVTDIAVQLKLVDEDEADDEAEDAFYAAIGEFSDLAETLSLTPEEGQAYAAMAEDLGALEQHREGAESPDVPDDVPDDVAPPQDMGMAGAAMQGA